MWNYRIVKVKNEKNPDDKSDYFGLYEVFYEAEGARSRTLDPINFGWYEDPEEIKKALAMALCDALKHPILDDSEIK